MSKISHLTQAKDQIEASIIATSNMYELDYAQLVWILSTVTSEIAYEMKKNDEG